MLKIYFGDTNNAIFNTAMFFNNVYEDNWIDSEIGKKIIKIVDKSKVINSHIIESPFLGSISPKEISGGSKTLLLVYFMPDRLFNASTCGDNCSKFFLDFAKEKDIVINLRHLMNFGKDNFEIEILNNKKIAHNMAELIEFAEEYV